MRRARGEAVMDGEKRRKIESFGRREGSGRLSKTNDCGITRQYTGVADRPQSESNIVGGNPVIVDVRWLTPVHIT